MNEKNFLTSKINIVQILLAISAILCDPSFTSMNIIPSTYLPKIVWFANMLTFVLRTYFTDTKLTIGIPPKK